MNISKPLILVLILCCTPPLLAEEEPPTLSFVRAAQIAQEMLEKQSLPKDHFIRTLRFVRSTDENPISRYEAYFEPPQPLPVQVDTETPIPARIPSIIIITMDGVAKLEERVIKHSDPSRRVIRRRVIATTEEQNQ